MEEKRSEISVLYDYYSSLLSERQRDVLDLYFNDDLSLSEIAEDLGITRQGVRNAVITGKKFLFRMEASLGMAAREKEIRSAVGNILASDNIEAIKSEAKKLLN